MSWIEQLYRTYENNAGRIGDRNDRMPLLPICHTLKDAHVQIVLDGGGRFIRAGVVPKSIARTIIPATEDSASRTRRPVPHALCDKLQYIASDYSQFGGAKEPAFEAYLSQLESWCNAACAHPKAKAVLTYIRKGTVVRDLVAARVLHLGADKMLLTKWSGNKADAPEIFSAVQGKDGQHDVFIRFSVEMQGSPQSDVWTDATLWASWVKYSEHAESKKGLCYVTGKADQSLTTKHPKMIRNSADGAKLISSNDNKDGFTFRGRMTTADEACGVGFEVTQKAHSALRWLIARQGWRDGDQAIVAWAVSGADVPDPLGDTFSLLYGGEQTPQAAAASTAQEMGRALSKKLSGYSAILGATEDVVVMGINSATPGRMAIAFYRELTGSEFLARVEAWHTECSWLQRFGKDRVFVGAPAPRDIAQAAFGSRVDEQLRCTTVERLLPCIVDGTAIPRDIVESSVARVCRRQSMELWEWEKNLGIACSLYRYQHRERKYDMALERNRKTRDYLYGRLLAIAEHMEARALYVAGEGRETGAARLMQRFADRPYSTWLTIETSLTPYRARLHAKRPGFLHAMEEELDSVMVLFNTSDYVLDLRLSGEFLLGYHCQRAELIHKPDQVETTDVEKTAEETTQQ